MLIALGVVAQLAIVAHAPDSVHACDAIEISIAVSGRASDPPRLVPPFLRPFDVLRGTTSPRVFLDPTSRGTVVAEYRYVVTTDQVGRFTLPAFEARSRADRISSQPLTVIVRPQRAPGRAAPSVVARARIDTGADFSLRIATPETVFVGQQATYEVAVFLNQVVRDRLRRNPTFYPPEMQAMLAYDLPATAPGPRQRSGSQCYDALVYRRALFPLVAGRLVIPPAQLVYATGLSSTSLFSREESHELQTDSVSIVAIEPPREGRPAEYVGAVGDVRVRSHVDAGLSRVGDPQLLTVSVVGTGNVKLFPRPDVKIPWAGLVPADERVRVDSNSARVGGVKEFDWVLTPRIAGEFDVPPVRYGYFDPARRRYDVAVATGDRLRVGPGSLVVADTGQLAGPLTIRARYGGPKMPAPQSSPLFWLALALVPMPALVSRWRRRPAALKRAAAPDPMRALAAAALSEEPMALRRIYVRALAQRLGCNPEDFTNPGALQRALRRAGVSEATAGRAEAHLRALDSAAFAPGGVPLPNAARLAAALARDVDSEALGRAELPFRVPVIVLVALLGAATIAFAKDAASAYFASGVSAYLREDYGAARAAFASAIRFEPRSADAWANYGTAAWALSDTAAAVHGWRQALALEPGAQDAQFRIQMVRAVAPGSPAWVPSMPANALVWLFAALWFAAWGMAWVSRKDARIPRTAVAMAIVALLVGLGAIEAESLISGEKTAIVKRAIALTSDPAMGMDRGPGVATGEVVDIVGRRGAWVRVEASDARSGWVPSSQLILLEDRAIPANN